MSTYEFECRMCCTCVELEMKMSDYDPAKEYRCPLCNEVMKRVITQVNFELKGQGWFNSGGY